MGVPILAMPKLSWTEKNIRGISTAKENTVFIVNSNHIVDFLREFEIDEQYIP
jgi:type III secretion system FlhB-like substrate exporter